MITLLAEESGQAGTLGLNPLPLLAHLVELFAEFRQRLEYLPLLAGSNQLGVDADKVVELFHHPSGHLPNLARFEHQVAD
ncbi:hypothetical protein D3C84_1052010 [compost metagenome]